VYVRSSLFSLNSFGQEEGEIYCVGFEPIVWMWVVCMYEGGFAGELDQNYRRILKDGVNVA